MMSSNDRMLVYLHAIVHTPYQAGLLYIARYIQSDRVLSADDRVYLMRVASKLYMSSCGRDLYFDL